VQARCVMQERGGWQVVDGWWKAGKRVLGRYFRCSPLSSTFFLCFTLFLLVLLSAFLLVSFTCLSVTLCCAYVAREAGSHTKTQARTRGGMCFLRVFFFVFSYIVNFSSLALVLVFSCFPSSKLEKWEEVKRWGGSVAVPTGVLEP